MRTERPRSQRTERIVPAASCTGPTQVEPGSGRREIGWQPLAPATKDPEAVALGAFAVRAGRTRPLGPQN
ncbi:MAG: hypothetical protein AABX97_08245 [Candidatus Thermoplasmatota archaeon]